MKLGLSVVNVSVRRKRLRWTVMTNIRLTISTTGQDQDVPRLINLNKIRPDSDMAMVHDA